MIVLKADSELKMTFERLIKTMHANVNWTGLFVALDNYLILQGEVRSLFFHFDSRKVAENIVDLPIKEDEIKDTDEAAVRDVINMILYAFGNGERSRDFVWKKYGAAEYSFRACACRNLY